MNDETTIIQTVHDLRRRGKPHKERLRAATGEQATSILFQRVCTVFGLRYGEDIAWPKR
jgi:hypothetical protein